MKTPWGDAGQLRAKKLRPGTRKPRAQGKRNQRERLFAALVATIAGRGYEATTIADLVALSGVSRSTFYELFEGKRDCLLAAIDALTGSALELMTDDPGAVVGDPDRARDSFLALLGQIASQPAAAKMCLVEAHAAGPEATASLDRIVAGLSLLASEMLERMPGREGMPPEIVRAIVGGARKVIYRRLLRGEEEQLPRLAPELWEWIVSLPPPPGPLRPSPERSLRPRRFEERQAASNPADRVLRAMAAVVSERGYQETTVAEVVERARTSQRTFYESFSDKEAAMVAALDSGSAQMLAAALPAFRRGGSWPQSIRATEEAMFHFAAEEPEYGRLGAVEMYAAGRRALEQWESVAESMEALLAVGFELAPDAPAIAPEAIGGALYSLLYDFVKAEGPERLPAMVPTAVYVTLAPFLGAEEAYAVAVE